MAIKINHTRSTAMERNVKLGIFVLCDPNFELKYICRSVTYIAWSSESAWYLKYCLMVEPQSWDIGSVWHKDWPYKWAASSEFGTYRVCEQRRFRRACASAQSRQNLRCSLIQAVSQRGIFRQKARSLAPLNGWACAVKICHDWMLEDTNSLDGAQI